MAALLTWLLWTLLTHTSAGTAQSHALAEIRPTITAIAATYAAGAARAPAVVALPSTCAACHTIAGTAAQGTFGPDLSHIGSVAAERTAARDYAGTAASPIDYIRESILDPNVYVVPGATYGQPGASTMTAATGGALAPRELNQLVNYLATLE